jgi:predicted class III extradiol MEMO1 family dioxygenase
MKQQISNTPLGIHYIEILFIKALVKKYPNDTDLGREIRKLYKPKDNDTDRKEHSHQDDRRRD